MTNATAQAKPTNRRPSIREIARTAGVSASTVSRVLNQRVTNIPIAEATKEKVLDACRRLRYQPNIHAKRLFAGRSNSLGVVIPAHGQVLPGGASYTDPNLAKTLAGILDAATEHGQHLVLVANDSRFVESGDHLNLFRNRSVDGMLIWGATRDDQTYIREVVNEGWPVVLVNSHVPDEIVPHVLVDNHAGAAALARHLVELGHRQIAFLAGPETASVGVARRAGFEEACREAGVELTIRSGVFQFESGRELAEQLLQNANPPTAIAAVDDVMALGVIAAAQATGRRVPDDLSVTGADDAFAYYNPRLTTFQAPMEQLGRGGVELLLKLLNDPNAWQEVRAARKHVFSGKLIIGKTTAPVPRSR